MTRSRIHDVVRAALDEAKVTGRVVVAVSGGPDSSVLLDVCAELAVDAAIEIVVATIDHGLRAEAADEAARVVEAARARGLVAMSRRVTLTESTPEAARQARYQALVEIALEVGARFVLVAHTADDQAETVLDRLVRGAGLDGLAAMRQSRPLAREIALVRPMLEISRVEVEAYVAERALAVVRDPSNDSLARRRGRIRHEVLPLLAREHGDVSAAIARAARHLGEDARFLNSLAEAAFAQLRSDGGAGTGVPRSAVGLDVARLTALDVSIAQRVLRIAAKEIAPLSTAHTDALLALARATSGTRAVALPGGARAERRYHVLWIYSGVHPIEDATPLELPVAAPGRYRFFSRDVDVLDPRWFQGGTALVLRSVRPGDRIARAVGHKKVSDLFIDAKVPRPERPTIPLLVRKNGADETVLWVPRLPPSEKLVAELPESVDGP